MLQQLQLPSLQFLTVITGYPEDILVTCGLLLVDETPNIHVSITVKANLTVLITVNNKSVDAYWYNQYVIQTPLWGV